MRVFAPTEQALKRSADGIPLHPLLLSYSAAAALRPEAA